MRFPDARGTNRRSQGNYSLFNMLADLAKALSDGGTGVSPVQPGEDARRSTGNSSFELEARFGETIKTPPDQAVSGNYHSS